MHPKKPSSSKLKTAPPRHPAPSAGSPFSDRNPSHQLSPHLFHDTEADSIDLFSAILNRMWNHLMLQYFPDRADLRDYSVQWSSRKQKRVLASCDIIGKRVRVARELARPEYLCFLSPLLYHEMCHAVIGREVETRNGARLWHGPRFKALESRHPESPLLQQWITVGGWATAVRRDRAFAAAQQRKKAR